MAAFFSSPITSGQRLKLVKLLIFAAFTSGILCSFRLWQNEDRLPGIIAPFDSIPALPAPADLVLLWLFLVSLLLWIVINKRFLGWLAAASLLIMLVQDQLRWQPWVYIYLLLLLPFLQRPVKKNEDNFVLNTLQLIVAGVYIWSGLHKLSVNFIEGPFAQIIADSGLGLDFASIRKMGYFIPLIEILMGLALLFPTFRKAGIAAAIVMHLFILFYLTQWATIQNSVVYPWNIAMILFVLLLFAGIKEKTFIPFKEFRSSPVVITVLVLVWIFPLLNIWGWWDHYPSFSFYSNKTSQYYIAVKNTSLERTDKKVRQYFVTMNGLNDGKVLDMNQWTLSGLNVPFYPELRVFKKASRQFYTLYKGSDSVLFLELSFVDGQPHFDTYSFEQLQNR